jgi:alanyl-tRNA synthetase
MSKKVSTPKKNGDSSKPMSGSEVRQAFLEFFTEVGHTVVPSSSLVPGNDPTLLFTNAGMVQFKDVFLGIDKRPYTRATTAQKCMRVSGKHNDLENVGPSSRHHTFFEMLGNFSFGDYFKQDACRYAYDCVTKVYGIDPSRLYFTVHKDDQVAYDIWVNEIGVPPERVAKLGDKTNFWQMADVGPCGPTAEIHYDFRPEQGQLKDEELAYGLDENPDHRFLEIWNLVFMQYSQAADGTRTALPKPGVDTGMGLERITMIVQGKDNSYDTDLFSPVLDRIQQLAGHTADQRAQGLVAYRVVADHTRAASFLISDGVKPGNNGRNYVCRMVVRRAARFGRKIGFNEPFMAGVAEAVIDHFGPVYPDLKKNKNDILHTIKQEEEQFRRTVDTGTAYLEGLLSDLTLQGKTILDGSTAFYLFSTYGLPLEITRDIAKERGFEVDEAGFLAAKKAHEDESRQYWHKDHMGENVELYTRVLAELQAEGTLPADGVEYNPYGDMEMEEPVAGLIVGDQRVKRAKTGDKLEVIIPHTPFYVEMGGQLTDTGVMAHYKNETDDVPEWEIRIDNVARPIGGLVVHSGEVTSGNPKEGDVVWAVVDDQRRWDIMRNHTATHLLHSELRYVLGDHVRQAGSLVAPERLRFDFTHHTMVTQEELSAITRSVNDAVLANYPIRIEYKSRDQATGEGAMALFNEKYGEIVRTVQIGEPEVFSYELCGGTHVPETADIGPFIIVSEGSIGSGTRRIEAVTGRAALDMIQQRMTVMASAAAYLGGTAEELDRKVLSLKGDLENSRKEIAQLQRELAKSNFDKLIATAKTVKDVPVLAAQINGVTKDTLREMTDWFRQKMPSGVAVFATIEDGKPQLVAAVSEDLTKRGLDAVKLIKAIAPIVGGGGGGKATLAQAGGKDPTRLNDALGQVEAFVAGALN